MLTKKNAVHFILHLTLSRVRIKIPSSLSEATFDVFREVIATGDSLKHTMTSSKIGVLGLDIVGNIWDNVSTQ